MSRKGGRPSARILSAPQARAQNRRVAERKARDSARLLAAAGADLQELHDALDRLIEWPRIVTLTAIEVIDRKKLEAALTTLLHLQQMRADLVREGDEKDAD